MPPRGNALSAPCKLPAIEEHRRGALGLMRKAFHAALDRGEVHSGQNRRTEHSRVGGS